MGKRRFKVGDRVVYLGKNDHPPFKKPATVLGYGETVYYQIGLMVRHDDYDYGSDDNHHCSFPDTDYILEETHNSPLYQALL